MRKAIIAALVVISLPAAQADQKNVKLLTGMSDIELQRTMNFMRASLGVHCDFCHVVNDKSGWDFASDEKTPKRMARHMIEMVEQINQQNFEGNPVVSCHTCHRGRTKPIGLVALPQAPPPFPTPIPAKPALPTRDEVVARYAAAIGDASRLQLPRALRGTREGFDGKSIPFEAQMSGSKMHIVAETPRGRIEQAFNGSTGWVSGEKGIQPMKDDEMENFHALWQGYEPLSPQAIPAEARVVGKEKIDDHDTVIVGARIDERRRQRLFFDIGTGLLIRRQLLTRRPVGEVPEQTDFDDYRDIGGTKFPFFVRLSLVDPWTSATRRYKEVQLGAKVDDSIFNPPAGSRP